MGFDLHGLAPKLTEKKGLLKKVQDEDGYSDWNELKKLSDKKQKQYWEEHHLWEKENPGNYFRNNVWWWRPLWNFVCKSCDDILTDEDMNSGSYNDGHEISSDKALDIYNRLSELKREGEIIKYKGKYDNDNNSLKDEECNLCNGTGVRTDMKVKDGCNKCEGTGKVRPWKCSYPFDTGNVYEFMEFCKFSGGFSIS